LTGARAFLELPGEVVSGHADRHVVRAVLGRGRRRVVAFLKREHRVPWRDRLSSAWAGFGWVSKSEREARVLQQLRQARIPVPRWLAYGEDGRGRAFLLVRAVTGAIDLRTLLNRGTGLPPWRRLNFARRLGRAIARVHTAGFVCPELWSKHVLVHPRRWTLALIDWQRSRRRRRVPWTARAHDLAALQATLAADLASPRERLVCVRAYLSTARAGGGRCPPSKHFIRAIRKRVAVHLRRRCVREQRHPPLAQAAQRLRWVEGEALCVTRSFWRDCQSRVPDWLTAVARKPVVRAEQAELVWRGRHLILRRYPAVGVLRHWLARLGGRRIASPALRQAGLIFRLQRLGVPGAHLLAFGQRPDGGGFILLRLAQGTRPIAEWLAAPQPLRAGLLRAAGALICKLHAASCRLTEPADLQVRNSTMPPSPTLTDVQSIQASRGLSRPTRQRDLAAFVQALALTGADEAAFLSGYWEGCGTSSEAFAQGLHAGATTGGSNRHA
jgi:tRNA A-37 threonylcarbamoyl transferase component Bud32